MAPDNQLFGMLMKAAGASGNLQLVLDLHDEMEREGLRPCTVGGGWGWGRHVRVHVCARVCVCVLRRWAVGVVAWGRCREARRGRGYEAGASKWRRPGGSLARRGAAPAAARRQSADADPR